MAVQYISAEKWEIALERVIKGCETGQIESAAVSNGKWVIPTDLESLS